MLVSSETAIWSSYQVKIEHIYIYIYPTVIIDAVAFEKSELEISLSCTYTKIIPEILRAGFAYS